MPKVEKAIKGRISSLISVIEENGIAAGFDQLYRQTDSELGGVIEDLYLKVGLRFARIQWRELQRQKATARKKKETTKVGLTETEGKIRSSPLLTKGFGFNSDWIQFIKDHLFRFLLEKIVFRVSETTRAVLLTVLNKAIENGWGIDQTVRELKELPLSKTQAARIVRTEVTRAANTGAMAAGDTFEYEQNKEWLAAHDKRTRGVNPEDHASHIGLDGQVIDYNDYFTDPRNGDQLMFPGDPQATAESTVNCRCSIAVIAKFDINGRLIPKRKHEAV